MKQILAGLIAMFLLSSCASSSSDIYLQRANCKTSASIVKDAEGYKLEMTFENGSDHIVRIQNPECLNQNVLVIMYSSSGEQLHQVVTTESESCGEFTSLAPGAVRKFVLPYPLNSLYGLQAERKYKVYFEYIGGFYQENGSMFGETIVKSSPAEFAVK